MRVLYLCGVGKYGGACRSLCENLTFIDKSKIDIRFIAKSGDTISYFNRFSKKIVSSYGIVRFDNTAYSFYRGIRWLVLLREIFFIPFTILAIIRAKIKWKEIDIIHVNEITEIFALVLLKLFYKKSKVIVHCRSVFRNKKESKRYLIIKILLNKYVDSIIAIDNNVKQSLPNHKNIIIINNSYSRNPIIEKTKNKIDIEPSNYLKIGYVGTISKMKGVFDLIESLNISKKRGYKFKLFIAGEEIRKYNNHLNNILLALGISSGSTKQLKKLIENYDLNNDVNFLGHVANISDFYSNIDVLCFPSRLNAIGRPILEAAYFSKPSIVTLKDPLNDTFIDYQTGIAVKPDSTEKLSEAIEYFIDKPEEISNMGVNAKTLFNRNFDPKKNTAKLINLYNKLLDV